MTENRDRSFFRERNKKIWNEVFFRVAVITVLVGRFSTETSVKSIIWTVSCNERGMPLIFFRRTKSFEKDVSGNDASGENIVTMCCWGEKNDGNGWLKKKLLRLQNYQPFLLYYLPLQSLQSLISTFDQMIPLLDEMPCFLLLMRDNQVVLVMLGCHQKQTERYKSPSQKNNV